MAWDTETVEESKTPYKTLFQPQHSMEKNCCQGLELRTMFTRNEKMKKRSMSRSAFSFNGQSHG